MAVKSVFPHCVRTMQILPNLVTYNYAITLGYITCKFPVLYINKSRTAVELHRPMGMRMLLPSSLGLVTHYCESQA